MSYVVLICGETGTCKTTLGLTFPKKLAYFELDLGGFDRAKKRFKQEIKDGQIVHSTYALPQQVIEDQLGLTQSSRLIGVKEFWYKLLTDYSLMVRDPEVSTIMIDSFTFLWEVCHMGLLQERQEKKPDKETLGEIEYADANLRIRTMIYQARMQRKNLILTTPMTDVRVDKLIRGEIKSVVIGTKYAGWRHAGKEVDFIIETSIREETTESGIVNIPHARILKSAVGLELVGLKVDNLNWSMLDGLIRMFDEEN